eukprot:4452620-Pleurochrysis_carterae.AAC.1
MAGERPENGWKAAGEWRGGGRSSVARSGWILSEEQPRVAAKSISAADKYADVTDSRAQSVWVVRFERWYVARKLGTRSDEAGISATIERMVKKN